MKRSCCSVNGRGAIFLLIVLLAFPVFASAQERGEGDLRLAVLDFEVQSENPSYKFLGKGFAEFIAVELSGREGITIVDREKRNAILEEQKFVLSGLAEAEGSAEIGRILSANYLLSGSVFDVFGQLEVTIQVVDVEQGTSVVNVQAGGEPKQYKKIITDLGNQVAVAMNLSSSEVAPEAEPEEELENEEADVVLTSFSEAVDAVDNNEVEKAKASLRRARKIDRENKAVTYYLNKLFTASPKFNVELIFYAPSYNPGSLGFITQDRLYLTTANNAADWNYKQYPEEITGHRDFDWELVDGLYHGFDLFKTELGYYLPLGKRLGLGVEAFLSTVDNISRSENYELNDIGTAPDYLRSGLFDVGGRMSFGVRLHENIGLGVSGSLFYHETNLGGSDGEGDPRSRNLAGAATLGIYTRFLDGNLIVDSHVSGCFIQEVYLDYTISEYISYKTAPYPIAVETSILGRVLGGRLNLSLKEVLELYVSFGDDDRKGAASRLIPAVEVWPADFFSVRAGGEYDLLSLNSMESPLHGFGVLGGLTFRLGPVDIDANYTYLQRPLRFYPGLSAPDTSLLVQVSWNGAFIKERKQ